MPPYDPYDPGFIPVYTDKDKADAGLGGGGGGMPDWWNDMPDDLKAILERALSPGASDQDLGSAMQELAKWSVGEGSRYSEWAAKMQKKLQEDSQRWQEEQSEKAWQRQLEEQAKRDAENERLRLQARAEGQERGWIGDVTTAREQGLTQINRRLPTYMPRSVSGALSRFAGQLGADFSPAWPGTTAEGTPQMPPMDAFLQSLYGQGFPKYILR